MEPLLYLAHRIPYPPNKGDKIRSYHVLRYLSQRYRVFLGCFVDSPDDERHVGALDRWCADVCAVRMDPRWARFRSLKGFLTGEALTLPYYRSARLRQWVSLTLAREAISKAVVFSSPMAQYLRDWPRVDLVVDLVDVDSAKWTSYSTQRSWPLSLVYRREGKRLLAFERETVGRASAGVLVTQAELELFSQLAPECRTKTHVVENGVDTSFFSPTESSRSPFPVGVAPLVFAGVMDYWPNIDAVAWFARDVLPEIVRRRPDARLYVVGMNPTAAIRALAADRNVVVTGKVDDVRPYLQYAAAVVVPLRIARGVQNKILEAMAMGRPVVASSAAASGVGATAGAEFEVADGAGEFVDRVLKVLDREHGDRLGRSARKRVAEAYCWEANLARFTDLLEPSRPMPFGETGDEMAANGALAT